MEQNETNMKYTVLHWQHRCKALLVMKDKNVFKHVKISTEFLPIQLSFPSENET